MKCPKCSLQNPETQKFCGDCGTSLLADRAADITRTTTIQLPSLPLPPGSVFAERYRIIEELGKGGMGRVIRALDMKLGEEIAIKFIRSDLTEDPAAVERFRTELKAARQVIHKNVARMFDLNEEDGVPYITMEYVRGGDLKSLIRKMGRLDAKQAVRIVKQVAEGLAEAHRTGVIHRDMKSHNIMVDEEGTARITDFGLARLRKTDDATLTAPGMGTPAYASPEQVEGMTIDHRSDLYSLGIVLFEMLTGELPFQGETPYSVALARLTKTPPDPRTMQPDIPEALVCVIMKCLKREREKRYQKAEELIQDLEGWQDESSKWKLPRPPSDPFWPRLWKWIKANRTPVTISTVAALAVLAILMASLPRKETSITVRPVKEINPIENRESFSYGLRWDITAKLGSIERLRVVPWPDVPTEKVADKELQLTLRTEGTILLVDVELINAESRSFIDTYTHNIEPASRNETEDEIVKHTAQNLRLVLNAQRLALIKKRETADPDVFNFYWEGKRLIEQDYLETHRPEDFAQAVNMLNKAVEINPRFALPYWALGNAYEARYYYFNSKPGVGGDPEDLKMMEKYYKQAHEIAPLFAETNLGQGWVYFNHGNNSAASKFFKKAFDLEPENPIVNQDVGAFLRSVGLYDIAPKYLSRAVELSSNSVAAQNQISSCFLCLGKFGKARRKIEKLLVKNPYNYEALSHNITTLIMMNRLKEAEKEIETIQKINPSRQMRLLRALLFAAKGEKEEALSLINGKDPDSVIATYAYILLDLKEDAINAIDHGIEHAFEEYGHYMYSYVMLSRNPLFKRLKKEPRFQEILRRQKENYEEELRQFAKF